MRHAFVLTMLVSSALLSGCSQKASEVPVHLYGGKNSGAGSLGIHTLKSGDTLWGVANAYHVDLRDLLDLNRLRAPYAIHTGDRLKIPAPLNYTVHKGDTLYRVSRMFDATTTELAQLNKLRPPYVLKAGDIIRLPSKHAITAPTIKTAPAQLASTASPYVPQKMDKIQRESLPPAMVENKKLSPTPSQQIPKKVEEATEVAEVTPPQPQKISGKGFLKPVSGKIISSYGTKADGLHNDGINIKATRGDPVRASENGVVVYSGSQIEGYGNMLLVRHTNGYMTAYAHMDKSLVKKGDVVKRGQVIGTVGTTGHVDTPQLHFEIRKGKDAIDPGLYMKG